MLEAREGRRDWRPGAEADSAEPSEWAGAASHRPLQTGPHSGTCVEAVLSLVVTLRSLQRTWLTWGFLGWTFLPRELCLLRHENLVWGRGDPGGSNLLGCCPLPAQSQRVSVLDPVGNLS